MEECSGTDAEAELLNQDTQRDEPQCYLHGSVPSKATSAANTSATNITTTISAIKACWENTCAHATLANPRYGDKKNKILIQQKHTHTHTKNPLFSSSRHLPASTQRRIQRALRSSATLHSIYVCHQAPADKDMAQAWEQLYATKPSPHPPKKKNERKKNPIKDYTG